MSAAVQSISPRSTKIAILALHLAGGVALGFFFHYLLYRLSLPMQPFIYVAF